MAQNGEEKTFSEGKTSPVSRIGAMRVSRRGFITLASLISTVPIFAGFNGVGVVWTVLWGSLAAGAVFAADADKEDSAGSGTLIASVPLGFLLLTGWVTVIGVVAATVHLHVWNARLGAATVWAVGMGLLIYAGQRRKGKVAVVGNDYAAAGSYLILGSIGLWIFFTQSFEVWSRNIAGSTDYLRHLSFMKNTIVEGNLTYGTDVFFQTYPRSIHAFTGVVWNAAGGSSYESAWKALECTSWLMLVFLFTSLVLTASTVAKRVGLPWWLGDVLIPGTVLFVLVQGAWINNFVSGFIASVFSGVVITVLFTYGVCSRWVGSKLSVFVCYLAFMLLSHSWAILAPVAGVLALVSVFMWLRQNRKLLPAVGMISAGVLTLLFSLPAYYSMLGVTLSVTQQNPVAQVNGGGNLSIFAIAGDSNLTAPTLWWFVSICASFVFMFMVMRLQPKMKQHMWWYFMTVASGLLLSAVLIIVTKSTWTSILYYPLKTLWVFPPLTLPFSIVGFFWILQHTFLWAKENNNRYVRLLGLGSVVIVIVCCFVIFAGQTVGSPYLKQKIRIVSTGNNTSTNSVLIPIAETLEEKNLSSLPNTQKIIVFGYIPYGTVMSVSSGKAQIPDVMGAEVGVWRGYTPTGKAQETSRTIADFIDLDKVCTLLAKNPDALYVTGPNPATGPDRLLKHGCPESIVQPGKWVVVPISDRWFEGTLDQGKTYQYPTEQELEDFKKYREEGGNIFKQ